MAWNYIAATTESHKTWTLVERLLELDDVRSIYLSGPPGIGKTYLAYSHGRIKNGVYAITLTEDTPTAELRGHYVPKGGGMEWHDGPFIRAMREGARCVVNELTHAPAEVFSLLHPILESVETARLTLPTGETIKPANGFHLIATDNVGPEALPEALQDRFDAMVTLDMPHRDAIKAIREDLREAACRTFNLEPNRRLGVRAWHSAQRLIGLGFKPDDAFRMAMGPEKGSGIAQAVKLGNAPE